MHVVDVDGHLLVIAVELRPEIERLEHLEVRSCEAADRNQHIRVGCFRAVTGTHLAFVAVVCGALEGGVLKGVEVTHTAGPVIVLLVAELQDRHIA